MTADDLANRVDREMFGDLDTAQDEVAQRVAAVRASGVGDGELVGELVSEALSGRLSDDLAQRVTDHRAAREGAHEVAQVLSMVGEQLEHLRDTRAATGADAGLVIVRAEIEAVMAEAEPVLGQVPDEVHDGDDAIAAGVADSWGRLRELGDRHARAREVQRAIVSRTGRAPDLAMLAPVFGVVHDPDAHGPVREYIAAMNSPRRAHELTGGPIAAPELPWLSDDRVAVLRFLMRDDVEAWVPRMDELKAHSAEVDARTRPSQPPAPTPMQSRDAWREKGEWGPSERPLTIAGTAWVRS